MKKILSKIVLFIVVVMPSDFNAQNPNWQWAKIGGGNGRDVGKNIAIDAQGNVYVLGVYRDNNIVLGSTTLINAGDDDVFLAKYNAGGNVIWAKTIGSSGTEFASTLLIDKNNNIYVSGGFNGTTLTIGTTTLTNSTNNYNFFVAKYDTNGQLIWAKNNSNSNLNGGFAAIDNDLNSYSIIKTPTVVTLEKRNASENLIWSKTLTTTGTISSPQVRDVFVNQTGVYLTGGFFGNSLTIGSTTITNSTPQNSDDMFVAKLDTLGNVIWLKNAINTSGDHGTVIKVDDNGNVYVLGGFSSGITFDGISLTSNGSNDAFVVKYNPSGQVLWAKNAGGIYNDWVSDLEIDAGGGAYIIGETFSPSITFANTTLTVVGNIGNDADVYILKFNSIGDEKWIKGVQALGSDDGNGIAINNTGEIYVTGSIEGMQGMTTNIGTTSLTHFGLDDFFLAKLSSTVGVIENNFNGLPSIYPNPTNGLINISNLETHTGGNLTITNLLGQTVFSQQINTNTLNINLANQPKGIYLVKISSQKQNVVRKVVVE